LFNHHVPVALVLLGVIEAVLLFGSAELAWRLRTTQIGMDWVPMSDRLPQLVTFTVVLWITMLAVGVYHAISYRSLRIAATRMAVAIIAAIVALAVIFFLLPDVALWRSTSAYAVVLSFLTVMLARWFFLRVVGLEGFRRRILVLGAGTRAARLAALSTTPESSFVVARFVRMTEAEPHVHCAARREDLPSMAEVVAADRIDEVVVAIEERRGALPMADLLQVRMEGVIVSDISTFVERETGRVDLDSVRPSWFIFSDGFESSVGLSVVWKRVFDIVVSLGILLVTAPVLLIVGVLVKLASPGPVFYKQERVGRFGRVFNVIKFRSMREDAEKDGPVWAQQGDARVTPVGAIIRKTRIDEIPQVFCVLAGQMSFIGPRPERPVFVRDLTQQIPLYNERHVVKPGITGWAQINYPYGASVEDARHKLEYDLYYIKNYSLFLDLLILIQTVRVVLWQDGSR